MKRQALILFLCGFCMTLTFQPVLAAQTTGGTPPTESVQAIVPMSTVLQNLKMNGYEIISKVELTKGVFNIEALTPQGNALSISMDAHSGEITSPKQNPAPHLGLAEAVSRVEGSGYHNITQVEYSGGKYVVRAMDQKDKKVKLKVDGNTGEISKAWF